MSDIILKQPNGFWAIYNDTADEFIMEDATKGQVITYKQNKAMERAAQKASQTMDWYEEHGKTKGLGRTYEDFVEADNDEQ